MFGRAAMWLLILAFVAGLPGAAALANQDEVVLKRDDEYAEVAAQGDDDDDGNSGGGTSGFTSGENSNDRTGSGHTGVSRDRDRSRGDKTRDWTRDRTNDRKRDWSGGKTNDRSRNDTR